MISAAAKEETHAIQCSWMTLRDLASPYSTPPLYHPQNPCVFYSFQTASYESNNSSPHNPSNVPTIMNFHHLSPSTKALPTNQPALSSPCFHQSVLHNWIKINFYNTECHDPLVPIIRAWSHKFLGTPRLLAGIGYLKATCTKIPEAHYRKKLGDSLGDTAWQIAHGHTSRASRELDYNSPGTPS